MCRYLPTLSLSVNIEHGTKVQMVSIKVEDGHGPRYEAVTQLADAVQAGGPGDPAQPGLGVSGEVCEPGAELPPTDIDNHVSLVSVTLATSERL